MNKNEYYQPEIEEFHIGFEFEFETGTEGWKKFIFDKDRPENVLSNVKDFPTQFRIKRLDEEDIESLGWKFIIDKSLISNYELNCKKHGDIMLSHSQFTNEISIESRNFPILLVRGLNLKNKSELKILMSQLGII